MIAGGPDRVRVAVVIPAWNGRGDLLACLDSVGRETAPDDLVVVVDNGSSDGTADAVESAHPNVALVRQATNLGFAAGANAGLRIALARRTRYVLLLNQDTVLAPRAIETLVEHAERDPRVVALQPLLVRASSPAVIDGAGHLLSRRPGICDAHFGRPAAEAPATPAEVFGACGAAAFLRASALEGAGLLDEDLFLLCEDADLMFRLRTTTGGTVELVPAARVLHRRGISGPREPGPESTRRAFWLDRNTVALALRWWPTHWLLAAAPFVAGRALRALVRRRAAGGRPCLGLWGRSLGARRANRAAMRRLGLDRWFGAAPPGRKDDLR